MSIIIATDVQTEYVYMYTKHWFLKLVAEDEIWSAGNERSKN